MATALTNILDNNAITAGIIALFEPGQVVEFRVPKAGRLGTISGYFDDFNKLAASIAQKSGQAGIEGLYYTLNPVDPALLARSANHVKQYARLTTSDANVLRRRWLLIDVDPYRPAGVSATDSEKLLAAERVEAVREYLHVQGWPDPVCADSGNGYHLLYRIDLPNDEDATTLVKGVLEALAERFDDNAVKVDRAVFNAARIVKAYGSVAAKGDNTSDRPHRVARLLASPVPCVVSQDKLRALAAVPEPVADKPTATVQVGRMTPEKVEAFLDFYGVAHQAAAPCSSGTKWVLDECVFNPDHTGKDAAVILRDTGMLGYECFHASCQDSHWHEFRRELERRSGKRFVFLGEDEAEDEVEDFFDETLPDPYPSAVVDGDLIGELARAVTDGTIIPAAFARQNIKTVLGAILNGHAGFPGHADIHLRQYSINVSPNPHSGKGEAWKRIADDGTGVLHDQLAYRDSSSGASGNGGSGKVNVVEGGQFSSGEKLPAIFEDCPRAMAYFDEMSQVMQKAKARASTLEPTLTMLFERQIASHGSLTHGERESRNAQLSFVGNFIADDFRFTFQGRGSVGSGFLSRVTLTYSDRTVLMGEDWAALDDDRIKNVLSRIRERIDTVVHHNGPFIPVEDADAKKLRREFFAWLDGQEPRCVARLQDHFKRDLVLRAVFSSTPEMVITADLTRRSIAWATRQLEDRRKLWPEDSGSLVEIAEQKIMAAIRAHRLDSLKKRGIAGLADSELTRFCNVRRPGSGGFLTYNRAKKELLVGHEIRQVGLTQRSMPIYDLV